MYSVLKVDGDDDRDRVVTNENDDNCLILFNSGSGTFGTGVTYATGDRPWAVVASDLDNDDDIDLAIGNYISSNISILINVGDGAFSSQVTYDAGNRAESIALGDVDGDSHLDLAATGGSTISVLPGNGDGTFSERVIYSARALPDFIAVGDLDADGDCDLVTANPETDNLSFHQNNGDGTFGLHLEFRNRSGPRSIVVADLDGDLDLDLATANSASNTVSVLLNECIPAEPSVVVPSSMVVTRGNLVAGSVVELGQSDNMDLSIRRSPFDLQSRTEFEVKGISPIALPTFMEVTIEGSVFARSAVIQTVEFFNFDTSSWEVMDSRPANRFADTSIAVTPTGDVSRFVEPGTGCVEMKLRFHSSVQRQIFTSNTDWLIWSIR
ncbi:MAG: VCBS repeat-containing protein [Planctomycetota bacterium]